VIDPIVRAATLDDLDDLQMLEAESRAALADQRGGERWLQQHRHRGPRWADVVGERHEPSTNVFVGLIDDVVVGYLVLERPEHRLAVVEQVYVTPGAREVGIGDELLAAAVDHARSTGASLLEGEALPGDRDTKNLFERARITARLITVSKRLDR
jgi:GNAT superfamily N-acetyltransferase